MMETALFDYSFRFSGKTDIGKRRENNQDAVMLCPEIGFFAVSDGMGGLTGGKIAAEFIAQSAPEIMKVNYQRLAQGGNAAAAADVFKETVRMMSDRLFETGNTSKHFAYGATFAGVWLIGSKAIFACLGDSRGYVLSKYKKNPVQITHDHNMAAILVGEGLLTREEAKNDPSSSRLTAFVGMQSPAMPEVFTVDVRPGDRILLCSDGLYGMAEEREMARLMRASRSPERVVGRLIDRANENGGRDNISAVYIKVTGK